MGNVRPSVCLSVRLTEKSHYQSEVFVCVSTISRVCGRSAFNSAVGSHVQDITHIIDWKGASVLIKDQDTFTRKFKEAIFFKAVNPDA